MIREAQSTSPAYDVCLSFAGEDRQYVEQVAEILRERGVLVFYDRHEKAELWGKDLYTHLDEVYRKDARFCVLFISQHYVKKPWPNHERQSAQARAFGEIAEYILPVRFDDTEIPGLRPTVGYIDLRTTSAAELSSLIIEKLGDRTAHISATIHALKPDAAVPILIDMLRAHNAAVRLVAAQHLTITAQTNSLDVDPPNEVIPTLISVLADVDAKVRRQAVAALRAIGPRAAASVPALVAALADDDVDVRREAVAALQAIGRGAAASVPALVVALADDNADVRREANTALSYIDSDHHGTIQGLVKSITTCDQEAVVIFASKLSTMGVLAMEPLLDALRVQGEGIRSRVHLVLQKIGPPGFVPLIEALADPNKVVRETAIDVLSSRIPDARNVLESLNRQITDARDFKLPASTSYPVSGCGPLGSETQASTSYHDCPNLELLTGLGELATPAVADVIDLAWACWPEEYDNKEILSLVKEVLKGMGAAAKSLLFLLRNHGEGDIRNSAGWALHIVYGEPFRYVSYPGPWDNVYEP